MYCTHVACISDLTYSKHKHRTGWLGRPMNMASTSKTPQQCKTWSIALLGGGETLIKIKMLSMVLLDSTVWNESCWWNIDGVSRGISQNYGKFTCGIRSYVWASCTNAPCLFKRCFSWGTLQQSQGQPFQSTVCLGGCEMEVSHSFFDHLCFASSRICVECFGNSHEWMYFHKWGFRKCTFTFGSIWSDVKRWQLHWTLPKWPVVAIPILPDLGPPSSLEPGNCIIYEGSSNKQLFCIHQFWTCLKIPSNISIKTIHHQRKHFSPFFHPLQHQLLESFNFRLKNTSKDITPIDSITRSWACRSTSGHVRSLKTIPGARWNPRRVP